jgi:2-oxoglutarate dehydrogenase E2 component (dihydrolipoamide succinyltransferase)
MTNEQIKITLPKLGESIVSATVLHWFKKVGDRVALDEPLLEVSTDKVNSEIPSPAAGVLQEICVLPEQEVQVGEVLAVLASHAEEIAGQTLSTQKKGEFLTPAVSNLIREKGICPSALERIPRTGEGGRLTKKDVEAYGSDSSFFERVKMSGLRKAIAENMVKSFYGAPHASLVTEVDVTNVVKQIKERKQQQREKVTISSFVARAIAQAVGKYPLINSSLEEDTIVMKRFVHLGIAVSVEQGVVVPVVRNCQQLTLEEISREIAALAEKARTQRLAPEDVRDGTVTMTNFGMTGIQIGIPIIRYPEVAIIGLGAITKKVQVMPDDSFAIRSVMMISLTFDHRVLDGLYGCGFLNEIKQQLEAL